MYNKRVFVTGGAGVIGTALVQLLIEKGAVVFVGDLKPCPKPWWGKVKYRQGDLNTLESHELEIFAPEIVFHLAATFERSEESYSFLEENFRHNLHLSHVLIKCLKNIVSLERIVFASSYLVYDPALYLFPEPPKESTLLTEETVLHPRNLCGAAKLFHEHELHFLNHFLGSRLSCVSARIFRVYGRHSRDIISRWIRTALRGEPISLYRPQGRFDYVFADDVAEGLLRLAVSNAKGVVNLGTGQSRSVAEVLQILKQFFPTLQCKNQASDIPFEASQASIDRLITWTGWSPSYTLEMAIPQLVAFEKVEQERPLHNSPHLAVLITSISKKMPLIEAVRNAADQLGQFQIIHGCDQDHFCVGQYGVDTFWHCPSLSELTAEQVISYCQQNQITAIIPTRDADVEFYAQHLSVFQQKGIHLLVSSLDTITTCLDKKIFADVLLKEGFPAIPAFLSVDDLNPIYYVVKERRGAGSALLGLALNRAEAIKHSQCLQQPVFQPYVKGMEWSVDLYCSFEGQVKGCVARKRNQVVQGESQVTTTVHHPVLEHLCQEMAKILKIQGPAVFQLLEDESGEFHVIECNPRFGGASTASIAVGWDVFFWFFIECLGHHLHDYPFLRCKGDIRQIRYPIDQMIPWT